MSIESTSEVVACYVRTIRSVVRTRQRREASTQLLVSACERISAARATIAPWKRRRIAGGSAGSNGDVLADRVRDLVERGVLPRELVNRVWAGKGTGVSCPVCEKPIDPTDVEFEIEGIHLHRSCHGTWIRVISST